MSEWVFVPGFCLLCIGANECGVFDSYWGRRRHAEIQRLRAVYTPSPEHLSKSVDQRRRTYSRILFCTMVACLAVLYFRGVEW